MITDTHERAALNPAGMPIGSVSERYLFLGKLFRYVKAGIVVGAGATKYFRFTTPDTAVRALLRVWVIYTVAPTSLALYEEATLNAAGTDRSADILNLSRNIGAPAATVAIREDSTFTADGTLLAVGLPYGALGQALQFDAPIECRQNSHHALKLVDAGAGSTIAVIFEWAEA